MRISDEERRLFVESVVAIDPEAKVWLFGSRTDDEKRGGDIDLAILSTRIDRGDLRRIRRRILDRIGEQHIDIVTSKDGKEAFFRLAMETGAPLDA